MNNVFLLLGSNLGQRELLLQQAITQIALQVGEVTQQSSVYETQSWGRENEPDYLNQVITAKTKMPANTVLNQILEIELQLGRKRFEKWGSRLIDIDILFFNNDIIEQDNLTIPHPQLQKRRFTLEPLAEIAPNFMHPVLNKTIVALKNELNDDLVVKKL
ncbi:2-amino-4-hydroxy-6-hydroxymethyldihydropteridine diphosphokinase [Mucilaginibacter auburnensis]|uniref:2-amino-4-hydroxy-6-hydroxymethyldihydropteridine pyrophosphokinase n=1 Tax=Mucilaginibacter auburnensis TaxID=1457233 RepID=A0A2H9VUP8_9SPHI|nr:2-amino-4-hydroxy-6-hydroxymethyldihydropteridine diphosphokinase [Mucilaginibacter auburnensis]PJJ84529.1 2-amino-4-hydroxy-6-hydroxymethyldihydropteridine diphosphokinase [Mucilaginibacter auburnensis]